MILGYEAYIGLIYYGPKWSWAEMVMGRNDPESPRAVIDIGDIDVSIKMSFDINIDIENVDINILELVVTIVLELASLITNPLKSINHSETM